ncbi:MAG: DUF3883 domain-containing protein [Chitinophagales bacterium]|nr:DUF3883 domain-containing protein [Chitinophagales bacterium]
MLKELSKYENLGTPGFHEQLIKIIVANQSNILSKSTLLDLFHNKRIDNRVIFDGCIPLLEAIGILTIDEFSRVSINHNFKDYVKSKTLLYDKLVEFILLSLKDDLIFHSIFCSNFISYDIIYHSLQIDNSAFPLRYSSFKQLLIDFRIIEGHPVKELKKFIINNRYKKIFDKAVLPEIKRRKIGVEELKRTLEQSQIHGEEAERFVLDFELKRLNNKKNIDWVAEYSVADGYDIASYENEFSIEHDRFIEVKSYEKEPYFFWSRNEIEIARIKRDCYYLYLVDRTKIKQINYSPIIIKDPYNFVYKNNHEWDQRIEKIRFSKKNFINQ